MAHVMVVESHRDTCRPLVLMIEQCGRSADCTADAAEAREVLRTLRPDLLVVGAGEPGADGLELLRALREDPGLRDLPAVVYCGSGAGDAGEHRRRAMDLGARAVVAVSRGRGWDDLFAAVLRELAGNGPR